MTDQTTAERPVIVFYSRDAEPTPEQPGGFRAGQSFEAASVEVAKTYHPSATILRYADGGTYEPDVE